MIGADHDPAKFPDCAAKPRHCAALARGQPSVPIHNSLGRDDATARGGYYLVQRLATKLGLEPGARVAIQGFGDAGRRVAPSRGKRVQASVRVSTPRGRSITPPGSTSEVDARQE